MAFHQLNREVNSHEFHEADCLVPQDIFIFNLTVTVQNKTRHPQTTLWKHSTPAVERS